jgi:amino acid transporter
LFSILAGLCHAELSARFPTSSASTYRCVYAACGELLAFLIGWTMIAEYCLVAACAAKGWSDYVNGLWNGSLVQLLEDHVVNLDGIPSLDHTLDLPAFTLLMSVTVAACVRVKVGTINVCAIASEILISIFIKIKK